MKMKKRIRRARQHKLKTLRDKLRIYLARIMYLELVKMTIMLIDNNKMAPKSVELTNHLLKRSSPMRF